MAQRLVRVRGRIGVRREDGSGAPDQRGGASSVAGAISFATAPWPSRRACSRMDGTGGGSSYAAWLAFHRYGAEIKSGVFAIGNGDQLCPRSSGNND